MYNMKDIIKNKVKSSPSVHQELIDPVNTNTNVDVDVNVNVNNPGYLFCFLSKIGPPM